MTMLTCPMCSKDFVRRKHGALHIYCSVRCRGKAAERRKGVRSSANRTCRACGVPFSPIGSWGGNRQHCSLECSRASAKRSRQEFAKRNPGYGRGRKDNRVGNRKRAPRPKLQRLWAKYPDLPRACEACGEDRVLDVAHRPEFTRDGAWAIMELLQPHMIWVLCLTCHALLDRLGYSAAQLGIKPRLEIAA